MRADYCCFWDREEDVCLDTLQGSQNLLILRRDICGSVEMCVEKRELVGAVSGFF